MLTTVSSKLLACWGVFRLFWLRASGSCVLRTRLYIRGVQGGSGLDAAGSVELSIHRTAKVTLGKDIQITSCSNANPVASQRVRIWVGPGAVLDIGNGVGLSNCTIVCMKSVAIQDDVMIGGGASIYDSDFHSLAFEARIKRPDLTIRKAPVLIERGAFVGAHAIILKGSVVGEKSVLGAGSVLAGRVPRNEIWAGNPARFVRVVEPVPL
jgi:acetyltransferase-like isoleucine patch superfamily enzyme